MFKSLRELLRRSCEASRIVGVPDPECYRDFAPDDAWLDIITHMNWLTQQVQRIDLSLTRSQILSAPLPEEMCVPNHQRKACSRIMGCNCPWAYPFRQYCARCSVETRPYTYCLAGGKWVCYSCYKSAQDATALNPTSGTRRVTEDEVLTMNEVNRDRSDGCG